MIEASAIVLYGDPISEQGFIDLNESSLDVGNDFDVVKYSAVDAADAPRLLDQLNLKWTYPWSGYRLDLNTGLKLTAYPTKFKWKRVACALSHYMLWKKTVETSRAQLILEHDAYFIKKLDVTEIDLSSFNIVGLNNPIGATRKPRDYYELIREARSRDNVRSIIPVPRVDSWDIPQGLAGNSAYIITPQGAADMLKAVENYGLWPNDALMCYQLIPRLGVTTTHYTKVQGLPSTTTQ